MHMDMVHPWRDPWKLSPCLRPSEAWAVPTHLCGRSRPLGPPRPSGGAYVGRGCHCHYGSGGCSRHLLRLVWGDGSLSGRTIAARTRDLILHTVPASQSSYRPYLSVIAEYHPFLGNVYDFCGILESCGKPDPGVCLRRETPSQRLSWVPAAMLGCNRAPPWFVLRNGVKRYPGPHGL